MNRYAHINRTQRIRPIIIHRKGAIVVNGFSGQIMTGTVTSDGVHHYIKIVLDSSSPDPFNRGWRWASKPTTEEEIVWSLVPQSRLFKTWQDAHDDAVRALSSGPSRRKIAILAVPKAHTTLPRAEANRYAEFWQDRPTKGGKVYATWLKYISGGRLKVTVSVRGEV